MGGPKAHVNSVENPFSQQNQRPFGQIYTAKHPEQRAAESDRQPNK
jgi:hypothetical protein